MLKSEGRKRSGSSELETDSAFFLRIPMISSSNSVHLEKRYLPHRRFAVEQLTTTDTCYARAAEFGRYV